MTHHIYNKFGRERKEKGRDGHLTPHSATQELPDDVLLEIFCCHRQAAVEYGPWKWHRLAQVCRRWRSVVFAYPRYLDLRIVSTYDKPIRNAPTFWPVLPIIIWYPQTASPILTPSDEDNISAILKNPARICEMDLEITRLMLAKFALSLEESFPALDHLRLRTQGGEGTIDLPSNVLDGSTPRLRVLHLKGTAIPMLLRLLSSSKTLISLRLEDITHDGSFLAEDFAIGLSTMTQLKSIVLGFHPETVIPSPSPIGPSPLFSRIVLPSLTEFRYEGDRWFLRYFVSRIDAPSIEQISVSSFYDYGYDSQEVFELFGLGDVLRSSRCLMIHICLSKYHMVFFHHFARSPSSPGLLRLQIPCRPHHPLLAKVCARLGSQVILSKVTHLEIEDCLERLCRDPGCWLDLFRALTGLRTLHVAGKLGPIIVSALAQVNGENICEIWPALQELHFGTETPSSTSSSILPFINERQLCGLPVSVDFKKLNWSTQLNWSGGNKCCSVNC